MGGKPIFGSDLFFTEIIFFTGFIIFTGILFFNGNLFLMSVVDSHLSQRVISYPAVLSEHFVDTLGLDSSGILI